MDYMPGNILLDSSVTNFSVAFVKFDYPYKIYVYKFNLIQLI